MISESGHQVFRSPPGMYFDQDLGASQIGKLVEIHNTHPSCSSTVTFSTYLKLSMGSWSILVEDYIALGYPALKLSNFYSIMTDS